MWCFASLPFLLLLAAPAADPAVARLSHRSRRPQSEHHVRLLGRQTRPTDISKGKSVASQLVATNPAISSVFLLSGSLPSVRIPPYWSFSLGFSRSTILSASSSPVFYSAALSPSADPLPAWLAFDESGLFLSGVAPSEIGSWLVQLCGGESRGVRSVCETFEIVVDASPHPGEIRAGEIAPASTSASGPSITALLPSLTISASSSTMPVPSMSPPAAWPTAKVKSTPILQRLNMTAGTLNLAWSPMRSDGTAVLDGHERVVSVDCSAVEGLAWTASSRSFVGNISVLTITDESYPASPWTPSTSDLVLPVNVDFSNGSSLALALPLSIYPTLLPAFQAPNEQAVAVQGQPFAMNLASDALISLAGSRPILTVSLDPSEAAWWLHFDAQSGQLTTGSPIIGSSASSTKRDSSKANQIVPLDLEYTSVVVGLEARDSITGAISHRTRTVDIRPAASLNVTGEGSLKSSTIAAIVVSPLAVVALLCLLAWLLRRPTHRARLSAALSRTFRPNGHEGAHQTPLGRKEMVRHSSLKEIAELKYDSEREAFDTTGQSLSPSPSSAATAKPSPSSVRSGLPADAASRRIITPPERALTTAVDRIVSLTRRVISGSTDSTRVASVTKESKSAPGLTTHSQDTISTYLYVHPVRAAADLSVGSRSAGSASSTSLVSTPSTIDTAPSPRAPARVSRSRSAYPVATVSQESSFVSGDPSSFVSGERASWETPSSYQWSATSPRSAYSRPSVDSAGINDRRSASVPPRPSLEGSASVGAADASLSSSVALNRHGGRGQTKAKSSSVQSHDDCAVISRADRISSTCAMHVRVSGASSSAYSAVVPEITNPAPAIVVDLKSAAPQRAALPFGGGGTFSTAASHLTDDALIERLARATVGGGHNRSFTADTSGDYHDDSLSINSSGSGGSFEAFYPIHDLPPSPAADDTFTSDQTTRQTLGARPRRQRGGSWYSSRPASSSPSRAEAFSPNRAASTHAMADVSATSQASVEYEARLHQPFYIYPVLDLSVPPARPGLVKALRVTDVGYERLPPWICFDGGVFEGVPMDGDEGVWEFLVKDVSRDRTLCHFTLKIFPASPSSSFFASTCPSASSSSAGPFALSRSPSAASSSLSYARSGPPKLPLPKLPSQPSSSR